jgi:hypothetical protein
LTCFEQLPSDVFRAVIDTNLMGNAGVIAYGHLLTHTSMRPNRETAAPASSSTGASSRTSVGTAIA